jgi:hypothetical protein
MKMKAKTVLCLVVAALMIIMTLPTAAAANVFNFQADGGKLNISDPIDIPIGDSSHMKRQTTYPLTGDIVTSSFHTFAWYYDALSYYTGIGYPQGADYVVRDYSYAVVWRWPGFPSTAAMPTWVKWNAGSYAGPSYDINWDGVQRDPAPIFFGGTMWKDGYWSWSPPTFPFEWHWYSREVQWGPATGPVHGPFQNGFYSCQFYTEWAIITGLWWGSNSFINGIAYYLIASSHYEVMAGIPANIVIKPETLNLGSEGTWIKATIEFADDDPPDVVTNIDVSTVRINNAVAAEANAKYGFVKNFDVGDWDNDGKEEIMVKFDRDACCALAGSAQDFEFKVTGRTTNNVWFFGSDITRCIKWYDHPK